MSFDRFAPMPERLHGERDERMTLADRALAYNITFLDDALRAILPHDLVLLGAPSGLGKTELALDIATRNAMRGRPTHYFALEAEPRELERRRKYALLSQEAHRCKLPDAHALNYSDWLIGRCEHIVGKLNDWAEKRMAEDLSQLFTYYRGERFGAHDLGDRILGVRNETTLIVVDHLHYVDGDEDLDENRSLHETVKIIRDVSLHVGRPILLVAHLRKKDERARKLVPSIDDFHGSSNITKIATQVITLERATDIEPTKWYLSPTYMAILKDRRAGAPRYVAVTNFNTITKTYAPEYTLGRIKGQRWEPLAQFDAPSWAKHHRAAA